MNRRAACSVVLVLLAISRLAAGELLIALDGGAPARCVRTPIALRSQQVLIRLSAATGDRHADDRHWADIAATFTLRNATDRTQALSLAIPIWRARTLDPHDGRLNSMLPSDGPIEAIDVFVDDRPVDVRWITVEIDRADHDALNWTLSVAPTSDVRIVARWRQPLAEEVCSHCVNAERSVIANEWFGQYETGRALRLTLLLPNSACWVGEDESCIALDCDGFEQFLAIRGLGESRRRGIGNAAPLVFRELDPREWVAVPQRSGMRLEQSPDNQLTVRYGFAMIPTTMDAAAVALDAWNELATSGGLPFRAPDPQEAAATLRALTQAARGTPPENAALRRFVENQRWYGHSLPAQADRIDWDAIESVYQRQAAARRRSSPGSSFSFGNWLK